MIISFFSTGRGTGSGPVDYLIARDVIQRDDNRNIIRDGDGRAVLIERFPMPEVLAGNAEQTRDLIDASPHQWRYTSGVIAFERDDRPSDDQQREVRDRFENLAFAGMAEDQRNILWVRHSHEDRVELHFLVPRMELQSGRSLNIAPPGSTRAYDALRDVLNKENDWADPQDPARARDVRSIIEQVKRGNARESLHDWVINRIAEGVINDRLQMIDHLKREGFEVTRQGKTYITALEPSTGERFRLKGDIFHENWTRSAALERAVGERHREQGHSAPRCGERLAAEDIGELRERLQAHIDRRADYNRERYGSLRLHDQEHDRGGGSSDRDRIGGNLQDIAQSSLDHERIGADCDRHQRVRELLVHPLDDAGSPERQLKYNWSASVSDEGWARGDLGRDQTATWPMPDRPDDHALPSLNLEVATPGTLSRGKDQSTAALIDGDNNGHRAATPPIRDADRTRTRIAGLRRAADQSIRGLERAVRTATEAVERVARTAADRRRRWHEIADRVRARVDRASERIQRGFDWWKDFAARLGRQSDSFERRSADPARAVGAGRKLALQNGITSTADTQQAADHRQQQQQRVRPTDGARDRGPSC
ncbi:relaxase/mobilization nuclease domain-containing protein [Ochrobactrum sp. C6C9]|nr:relaxase/mobilization nuclease domain-containing protein [Ochrobactrum sp. C6C9]